MIGTIAGDIIGSRFEGMRHNPKRKNFRLFAKHTRFTDDTVLSIATADAILFNRNYRDVYREYYTRYPYAGYGSSFKKWAKSKTKESYDSFGNGSAMRVSPVGWAFKTETTVLEEAERSAVVSHSHPEGIKGAQAVALAIFMAKNGADKIDIESKVSEMFEYNLRPKINPEWDVSCQGCVPQAFSAFLEAEDFEDTIRKAIFKGGDSDTIAAIAGSMAEAYYGIPEEFVEGVFSKLSEDLSNIVELFVKTYINKEFEKPSKSEYDWKRLFRILTR